MSKYRQNGVRLIPTEDEEQILLFNWVDMVLGRYPELALMHHIPNGGKRSKSEAVRFRAMGVRAGVADIFLPCARGGYHGLYIELKAMDGKVSEKQNEFLAAVKKQGYCGVVCYGAESAIAAIEKYMRGDRIE